MSTKDLLAKRRDRVIAVILGCKERECDQFLPPEAQARLRKVVLDELNMFTDLAIDLAATKSNDFVVNELFHRKLDEIHEAVVGNGVL